MIYCAQYLRSQLDRMIQQVSTHILSGFLGVGKTTAVLQLFRHKPASERWAVLVNEAGKTGIDQQIYRQQNIDVQEIPGGCMCCAQGVALHVAVNRLLRESRPDRLIIESSGVGHPAGVLKTLSSEGFRQSLQLKASIGLINPQHLLQERYQRNALFRQQIQYADILLANKSDLASRRELQAFEQLVSSIRPARQFVATIQQGRIPAQCLEMERLSTPGEFAFMPAAASTPDSQIAVITLQWATEIFLDQQAISIWLSDMNFQRCKGMIRSHSGWHLINMADRQLEISGCDQPAEIRAGSYLEVFDPNTDAEMIRQSLQAHRIPVAEI